MTEKDLLQFAPFISALDAGFWHQLSQKKLDVYKLDDNSINICGFYSNREPGVRLPIANIDYTSFNEDLQVPPLSYPLWGHLINTNTLEEFKQKDKKEILQSVGQKVWNNIVNKKALEDPSLLQRFLCLTFSDLKKFHYYYWLAFPAFLYPEVLNYNSPQKIYDHFNENQIAQLLNGYEILSRNKQVAFLIHVLEDNNVRVEDLTNFESILKSGGQIYLGFSDPCNLPTNAGWPLRNFLSLVSYHWSNQFTKWNIVCLRISYREGQMDCSHSIVLSVEFQNLKCPEECPKTIGWEKNKNKLIPRMVDMSTSMDPLKLANSAVDLNLKLMRWRLVPELELDIIKNTKCLLLGAGTLGCIVARCLLGWGVRKITFVDNSKVSYSNPVRQTLFEFNDCLQGGKEKAIAAANSLMRIFPGVDSEGKQLSIPMPGHFLTHNSIEATRKDVKALEQLIEEHDVVFLLMDTRESRWLPSVVGRSKQKIVINAALGFDSFLVMRHGIKGSNTTNSDAIEDKHKEVLGSLLGCYFCGDVVAPGNSTKDRTLDQQCTVTRPGASYMAAALAVELMVSILQHPLRGNAPAGLDSDDFKNQPGMPLGIIPHQIRGYMDKFQNFIHISKAFDRCTACSDKVLEMYEKEGFDFLIKVFNDPNHLEDITGLTDLMHDLDVNDVLELSDDESI